MKDRITPTTRDITTSLKDETLDTTIGKIKGQSQIRRALSAIRKGKFAYTF